MPKKVRILDFSDTTANILEYIVKFSNDGKLYLWFLLFWKNKKIQKSKHFLSLSKGKIKLFERPQTIGGESSMSHSPLKDFFDTWENEKNQIEPPFYNCDELELPF